MMRRLAKRLSLLMVIAGLLLTALTFCPIAFQPQAIVVAESVVPARRMRAQIYPIETGIDMPEAIVAAGEQELLVSSVDQGLYRAVLTTGEVPALSSIHPVTELSGFSIGLARDASTKHLWSATFPVGIEKLTIELNEAPDSGAPQYAVRHDDKLLFHATAFPEDITSAPDAVYFTIGSRTLTPVSQGPDSPYMLWNLLDGEPSGELMRADIDSGETELLLDGLALPSGLVLTPDSTGLLVVEIARYRILRYDLATGGVRVFADGLPGIPDDIFIGPQGHLWVSLAAPRSELLEQWLLTYPVLSRLVALLPHDWQNSALAPATGSGALLRLDANGDADCMLDLPDSSPPANGIAWGRFLLTGSLLGDSLTLVDPQACES